MNIFSKMRYLKKEFIRITDYNKIVFRNIKKTKLNIYFFIILSIFLWDTLLFIPVISNSTTLNNIIWSFFSHTCHQIPNRSFIINGRYFPVCIRCSTIYLGITLAGIFYFILPRIIISRASIYAVAIFNLMEKLMEKFLLDSIILRSIAGFLAGFIIACVLIETLSQKDYNKKINTIKKGVMV